MKTLLEMLTYRRPAGGPGDLAFRERFLLTHPDAKVDSNDNIIIEVGAGSTTLFSCHTDTVHGDNDRQSVCFDTGIGVAYKDDNAPLGADNGAGIWLLLKMIEAGVPGVYIFHYGEERGGIGSSNKAQDEPEFFDRFTRAVAFDRRGTGDIITHQAGGRCCSDTFALALAENLNARGMDYKPSSGGIFTDTANYTHLIPECTNVSVGYENEHTAHEHLDLMHLERLAEVVCLIDWESLPVERDHTIVPTYSRYGSIAYPTSSFALDGEGDPYDRMGPRVNGILEGFGYDPYAIAEYTAEIEEENTYLNELIDELKDEIRRLKQDSTGDYKITRRLKALS